MNETLNEINKMRKLAGKPMINEDGKQSFASPAELEKELWRLSKSANKDDPSVGGNPQLFEIMKAYADSFDWEQGQKIRNLNFKGEFLRMDDFLSGAEFVKSYNEFNVKIARKLVELFGQDAEYRLARENSVAVYIKDWQPGAPMPTAKYSKLGIVKADEFSKEPDGSVRLWWD